MTITRVNAETILIKRCGATLTAVGLDGTTIDGSNTDINDPLWDSLRRLGYTVTNISSVNDADIASVSTDDERAFLDVAELRLLESAYNAAIALVDVSVGPRRESLSQLAANIDKAVTRKREQVQAEHGLTGNELVAGVYSVASLEDGDNVY